MIVLVILHGYMVGVAHFQSFKEFVQRRGVFVHIFSDISRTQHFHNHQKILFIGRRFIFQIENERQEQHTCRCVPKRVVGLTAFRRGAFEQVCNKPLHIVIVTEIHKRIVAMAFLHIQKIEHPHLIAFLFQQISRVPQHFPFAI